MQCFTTVIHSSGITFFFKATWRKTLSFPCSSPCISTPRSPSPRALHTHQHTDTRTHTLLSDVPSWQSSRTSVFLWSKCARLDQLSPAQGQKRTIHHKPISIALSLSLCSISLCSSSICLSQPLSPPFCISDYKCSPAQGQLHALHRIFSSLPLSLCLTSLMCPISALYFSCFTPSFLSVFGVSCRLVASSSLYLYWLPSPLLLLYSISLSLSFCSVYSPAEPQG